MHRNARIESSYPPVRSLLAVTNGGPRPPNQRLLPGKTCQYLRLHHLVSAAGCALPQNKCHALVGFTDTTSGLSWGATTPGSGAEAPASFGDFPSLESHPPEA